MPVVPKWKWLMWNNGECSRSVSQYRKAKETKKGSAGWNSSSQKGRSPSRELSENEKGRVQQTPEERKSDRDLGAPSPATGHKVWSTRGHRSRVDGPCTLRQTASWLVFFRCLFCVYCFQGNRFPVNLRLFTSFRWQKGDRPDNAFAPVNHCNAKHHQQEILDQRASAIRRNGGCLAP